MTAGEGEGGEGGGGGGRGGRGREGGREREREGRGGGGGDHQLQFLSDTHSSHMIYVAEGAAETVVGLLYVPLLPVALSEAHPGIREARVTLHGTREQTLCLRVVLRKHVQRLPLQVGELFPGKQI